MDKDYKLLYYYEQLNNDTSITIRIPTQLKDDLIHYTGSRGYAKVLREFIINYVADCKTQDKN